MLISKIKRKMRLASNTTNETMSNLILKRETMELTNLKKSKDFTLDEVEAEVEDWEEEEADTDLMEHIEMTDLVKGMNNTTEDMEKEIIHIEEVIINNTHVNIICQIVEEDILNM